MFYETRGAKSTKSRSLLSVKNDEVVPRAFRLKCPYCSADNGETNAPSLQPGEVTAKPTEPILSLPYSRDIGGRFEVGTWSRIGQDYYSNVLGWERIGILRVGNEECIYYKVARCRECHCVFDVYLNYTSGRTLAQIWPHLLGVEEPSSEAPEIARYPGATLTVNLVEGLTSAYESDTVSESATVLSIGVLLVMASLWLNFFLDWLVARQSLGNWVQDNFIQVMVRLTGGVFLSLLLLSLYRFTQYIRKTNAFYDLFDVREKQHITFWLNFTLSRVVGVQKGQLSRESSSRNRYYKLSLTQSAVAGGLPSMLILFLSWFIFYLPSIVNAWNILPALFLLFVLYLLGASWEAVAPAPLQYSRVVSSRARHFSFGRFVIMVRRLPQIVNPRNWLGLIASLPFNSWLARSKELLLPIKRTGVIWVVAGAFVATFYLLTLSMSMLKATQAFIELWFWLVVAYYVGVAVWVGLNSSAYIMGQTVELPLKVDPMDRFRTLAALERVAHHSTQLVVVILLGALLMVVAFTVSTGQHQFAMLGWLLVWIGIGVVVLLIGLGTALSFYSRSALVAALAYILLLGGGWYAGLSTIHFHPLLIIDYRVILTGLFLSYVTYLHTRAAYLPLQKIRTKAQERLLREYDQLIDKTQQALVQISQAPLRLDELAQDTIRKLCENLNSLVDLRAKILQTPISIQLATRFISILYPLIFSILLPMTINWVSTYLYPLITGLP
jgi:hypothetical protein